MSSVDLVPAPELAVERWFNTEEPLTLATLRGRVVVIEAFQMLCPGCVSHGLPQAERIRQTFGHEVVVIGLHTVFEHHEAMTAISLEAFLHEYRITFPVGIDQPGTGATTPVTMGRYRLAGTPSLVVIDRGGAVRANTFGMVDDLSVGALLGRLIDEAPAPDGARAGTGGPPTETVAQADTEAVAEAAGSGSDGCAVDDPDPT